MTAQARTVVVTQSNYLPWKGYFDLINDADLCVFYDDVQFTKNDWRNRNLIKSASGASWITVPVGAHIHRKICEVPIDNSHWAAKHWRTICHSYAKAPFFDKYRDFFEDVYLRRHWDNLTALNHHLITSIASEFLGIKTKFADSRQYSVSGQKGDRLLELLGLLGASTYVSGPAAKSYIDEDLFLRSGIRVTYKSYAGYPEYPQFFPPFDHRVSVIDLLFHLGPQAPDYIWGWREQA